MMLLVILYYQILFSGGKMPFHELLTVGIGALCLTTIGAQMRVQVFMQWCSDQSILGAEHHNYNNSAM